MRSSGFCPDWGFRDSSPDLVHGEEPAEHGGGERADRGEERDPVHGAVGSQPGADPKPGQHPPSQHGESNTHTMVCLRLEPVQDSSLIFEAKILKPTWPK